MNNTGLPNSFVYFGTFTGIQQILKHKRLPLYRLPALKDPFCQMPDSPLAFSKQDLFEESVKSMTSAILGKEMPKGNPNHPLQKAISRWRGEQRFSSENEIRESLENLLPAMVEQTYMEAIQIHKQWQDYVKSKAILPLYTSHEDSLLWYTEGKKYSGIAIRFKNDDDSLFENCVAAEYSHEPYENVSIKDTTDLLIGMSQEIEKDFEGTITRRNKLFRSQKEWRLVLERDRPEDMYVDYPVNLIQSIYVGPLVDKEKQQQIVENSRIVSEKIKVYIAQPSSNNFELEFNRLS